MSWSSTVPAELIECVRTGARAELLGAIRAFDEAQRPSISDHDLPGLRPFIEQCCVFCELLARIGWDAGTPAVPFEMDPKRNDVGVVDRALDRFERDQPDEATEPITAFRRGANLRRLST